MGADEGSQRDGGRNHLDRIERLTQERLEELLAARGLVTREQLARVAAIQARQGGDLIRLLISLGDLDIDDFLDFLASQPQVYKYDLSSCEIDQGLLDLVPAEFSRQYQVFPIDRSDNTLTIGIVRPLDDEVMARLGASTGLEVRALLCSPDDIQASIERYYSPSRRPGTPEAVREELRLLESPMRLTMISHLIREIDSFPVLPETVSRVRLAMEDPKSSVRDVGSIIVMDPPVAAKVLSIANSAAYGFPQRIEDVGLAISLLGLRETYSIVLSAAVLNVLEKSKHFDYKRFWLEAMCCAAATRFVLKASGKRQLTGAFAAGLLHDIGRVVLSEVVPALYAKVDWDFTGGGLVGREEALVGLSHTEAGHELALHWGLPDDISEAIRFHHRPTLAGQAKEIVAVTTVAQALAHAKGSTLDENRGLLEPHQDALEILGLDAEIAEAMLDDFLTTRDESLGNALA